IVRAVVDFAGPLLFVVVSRYHGGAYVVFSKSLNASVRAFALTGSYASVIGGVPAASVIFTREVRARAAKDPTVSRYRAALASGAIAATRARYDRALAAAVQHAPPEVPAALPALPAARPPASGRPARVPARAVLNGAAWPSVPHLDLRIYCRVPGTPVEPSTRGGSFPPRHAARRTRRRAS